MNLTELTRFRVRTWQPVEADLCFRRRTETILEWLNPQPEDHILDDGCGYGFTLRALLALTEARVTALDFAQDRLDEIRQKIRDLDRVTLVHASAMELPFPDNSFDGLVCSEVIEHLTNERSAAVEIHRVLKPGGKAVITVPSENFPFLWDPPNWILGNLTGGAVQLKGERPWSGIWYGHERLYSREQLRSLMTNAGLEVVEERALTGVTFPFAHLLLYGIGKPLIRSGFVPARFAQTMGREEEGNPQPGGITRLAMNILEAIDAPNDKPEANLPGKAAVSNAILVRKPVSDRR